MENRAEREIVRWRHEYAYGTYEEGGYDEDGNPIDAEVTDWQLFRRS